MVVEESHSQQIFQAQTQYRMRLWLIQNSSFNYKEQDGYTSFTRSTSLLMGMYDYSKSFFSHKNVKTSICFVSFFFLAPLIKINTLH